LQRNDFPLAVSHLIEQVKIPQNDIIKDALRPDSHGVFYS